MTACAAVGEDGLRAAIGQAIDGAAAAYESRNRYMHDLLTRDVDEELLPDPSMIRKHDGFFLLRLATKGGTPAIASGTFDEAIDTARALIAATWKSEPRARIPRGTDDMAHGPPRRTRRPLGRKRDVDIRRPRRWR